MVGGEVGVEIVVVMIGGEVSREVSGEIDKKVSMLVSIAITIQRRSLYHLPPSLQQYALNIEDHYREFRGIKIRYLCSFLNKKKFNNFNLLKGNIEKTIPNFLKKTMGVKFHTMKGCVNGYV